MTQRPKHRLPPDGHPLARPGVPVHEKEGHDPSAAPKDGRSAAAPNSASRVQPARESFEIPERDRTR
jgi:hypothetical protein